jgi:hypothetical protein
VRVGAQVTRTRPPGTSTSYAVPAELVARGGGDHHGTRRCRRTGLADTALEDAHAHVVVAGVADGTTNSTLTPSGTRPVPAARR